MAMDPQSFFSNLHPGLFSAIVHLVFKWELIIGDVDTLLSSVPFLYEYVIIDVLLFYGVSNRASGGVFSSWEIPTTRPPHAALLLLPRGHNEIRLLCSPGVVEGFCLLLCSDCILTLSSTSYPYCHVFFFYILFQFNFYILDLWLKSEFFRST